MHVHDVNPALKSSAHEHAEKRLANPIESTDAICLVRRGDTTRVSGGHNQSSRAAFVAGGTTVGTAATALLWCESTDRMRTRMRLGPRLRAGLRARLRAGLKPRVAVSVMVTVTSIGVVISSGITVLKSPVSMQRFDPRP